MIRTVKEPIGHKEVQFSCKRSDCQAELSATKDDGEFVADPRDGDCYKFVCPHCCHQIYVDAKLFKATR